MTPLQNSYPRPTLERQSIRARANRTLIYGGIAVLILLLPQVARERAQADSTPIGRRASGAARAGQFGPYFRLQHYAGDGVGYKDSFSTFGLFQPIGRGNKLWFVDSQLLLTNSSTVGGNFGLGHRRYLAQVNRIIGIGLWADLDDRREATYQQVAVSLESLGQLWDFRANVYAPVGKRGNTLGYQSSSAPIFQSNRLLLSHAIWIEEAAMAGLDVEAGRRLPGWLGDHSVWLYGGCYHFENSGVPKVDGLKCRLEGYVTPNVSAQLSVSHDSVFDTSVVFGVSWSFPGGSARRGAAPHRVRDRLFQPTHRNKHIVVGNRMDRSEVVAVDPGSGSPLSFVHVDSNSAAGGDGSVEAPFQTLTEAQAGSGSDSILFAHADSLFADQGIVLQTDQRLWGEGIEHLVNTQSGAVTLPRATQGTALPIIANSPGSAITLADGCKVSGFSITDPTENAILANGLQDAVATVDNVTINGSGAEGVKLQQCSNTTITFGDMAITATGTHGIAVESSSDSTFTFGTTRLISPGEYGILLDNLPRTAVTFGDVLVNDTGWSRSLIMRNCNDATTLDVASFTSESGYSEIGIYSISNSTITFGDVRLLDSGRLLMQSANNMTVTFGDLYLNHSLQIELNNSTFTTGNIFNEGGTVSLGGNDSTFQLGNLSLTNGTEGLWVAFADRSTVRVGNLTADTMKYSALAVGYSEDLTFEIGDVTMTDTNTDGRWDYESSMILTNLTRGNITIGNTTLLRPGNVGINIEAAGTAIQFASLTIDDATDTGIIANLWTNVASLDFGNTTIRRAGDIGIDIFNQANNALTFNNLTIADSGTVGLLAKTTGTLTLAVSNASITNNGSYGMDLSTQQNGVLNATIEGSSMSANNGSNPDLRISAQNTHVSYTPVIRLNLGDATDPSKGNNIDSYGLTRSDECTFELGGLLGQGSTFTTDNGNIANNNNTSAGGAPNVTIEGSSGVFEIVDPASIPTP